MVGASAIVGANIIVAPMLRISCSLTYSSAIRFGVSRKKLSTRCPIFCRIMDNPSWSASGRSCFNSGDKLCKLLRWFVQVCGTSIPIVNPRALLTGDISVVLFFVAQIALIVGKNITIPEFESSHLGIGLLNVFFNPAREPHRRPNLRNARQAESRFRCLPIQSNLRAGHEKISSQSNNLETALVHPCDSFTNICTSVPPGPLIVTVVVASGPWATLRHMYLLHQFFQCQGSGMSSPVAGSSRNK